MVGSYPSRTGALGLAILSCALFGCGGGVRSPARDGGTLCDSPLVFPSNSQPPSMCPGVVLKSLAISFDPQDSRWAALYQACLDQYGSPIYPDECRQLCTLLANTNTTLSRAQGLAWCSLDCSQRQNPTLAIQYSDYTCERVSPDGGGSLLADAACSLGVGAPGEACGCNGACLAEAQCIQTRNHARSVSVCTAISAGLCVCGVWLDDRCQNGATCVCPSGGDDNGLCVTSEQRVILCSGDLATGFNCQDEGPKDAAPGTIP